MSLFDFDTELKSIDEKNKSTFVTKKLDELKNNGATDYEVEREKEKLTQRPERLQRYEPADVDIMKEVTFYFSPEDYKKFEHDFKVLEYVEANSNQNWLLLGLLKLIASGKIQYSEKTKEVWVI